MTLCKLCLGLHPELKRYRHHASFEDLEVSARQCELCRLIATVLEKNGDREKAANYRISVSGKLENVNDTSITISANRHDPAEDDDLRSLPYQLAVTCGPLHRDGMFAENKSVRAPVSILGIYAEEGTEAAQRIVTRPVPIQCQSDETFQLMQSWMSNCVQNHDECQLGYMDGKNRVTARTIGEMTQQLKSLSREEETQLPTRVLDLAPSGTMDRIRLIETNKGQGTYVALSHCWGQSQHLTTTKSTLRNRQNNIELNNLPKTFKDAVAITRRLGFRYLWLDSLCIIQDDLNDWERESSLMGQVYRNAFVTIAAANAVDGDGGCFHDRIVNSAKAIKVPYHTSGGMLHSSYWYVYEQQGDYRRSVWNGPLQKRAWTLQERCLARRIIHFATDQIYFECNKALQFENRQPETEHTSQYLSFATLYFMAMHSNALVQIMGKHHLTGQWSALIESFTVRGLTKEQDTLPALSGIANHLAKICQLEYVAGIWSGSALPDMLLWRVLKYKEGEQSARPKAYRAPSWSWAAMNEPVLFAQAGSAPLEPGHSTVALDLNTLKVDFKPLGHDPYGRISSGTINVSGWLLQMENLGYQDSRTFDESDSHNFGAWIGRRQLFGPPDTLLTDYHYVRSLDRNFWGAAAFDDKGVGLGQLIALLVKQKAEPEGKPRTIYGLFPHVASWLVLFLAPTGGTTQEYRRIGMGQVIQIEAKDLGEKTPLTII